jgi:hypothetical protein
MAFFFVIKYLAKKPVEFYIFVPIQPWVQKKIRHMKDWIDIGGRAESGEGTYIFDKSVVIYNRKILSAFSWQIFSLSLLLIGVSATAFTASAISSKG